MDAPILRDQAAANGNSGIRAIVRVVGNVQGVGFRPFLYRLAEKHALNGCVRNSLVGVELEVEGPRADVELFLEGLRRDPPPRATIARLDSEFTAPCGHESFLIDPSASEGVCSAQVAPDVAVCEDCLREFFDSGDRRHLFPFISCTNCGPRFSIIADLPYDRRGTSMSHFAMCTQCQDEYDDPSSRRFHCQTNACWQCGPKVWLQKDLGADSSAASSSHERQLEAIEATVRLLQQGSTVAIKGIGGFHLACDATDPQAVETLRRRKDREAKPFALMVPDLRSARRLCHVDDNAAGLLTSLERPIVLLPRRGQATIADAVAGRSRLLGLMLPYAPLHYSVLFDDARRARFSALVMTSGNRADEPIAIYNREAGRRLSGLADAILLHDRDILARADDSIVRCDSPNRRITATPHGNPPARTLIRRSRGYVPSPIRLKDNVREVLAVGGHFKSAIAVSRDNSVFLSQHIGDLQNLESLEALEHAASHLKRILCVQPNVVAHDAHPDYLSTRYAQQLDDVRLVPVQHHHAHVASCMADNGLDGPVIGVVLDGTGFGTDGHVWGGEILVADYCRFHRAAHLREIPLPGNEQAIKQPWRVALSYLDALYGEDLWDLLIPSVRELDRSKVEVVLRASRQGLNSPLTSSCGRLFDAASALIGLRQVNDYEGQAAIELEMVLQDKAGGPPGSPKRVVRQQAHPILARQQGTANTAELPFVIDQFPLIRSVVSGIHLRSPLHEISRRFHQALAELMTSAVNRVAEDTGVRQVALSGGCLQNAYLKNELTRKISDLGLSVFSHQQVPPNDGGLALGQLMIASRVAQ